MSVSVCHLKYPLVVVAVLLLTDSCFVLILDLVTRTAVVYILGLFFQTIIPWLYILIILHSLLLCSVVILLPAGDAVGDSEG